MSSPGQTGTSPPETLVHATCVAADGRAVLIRGASGAGKSALALHLIALGAALVADDRTRLWRAGGLVMADVPGTIRGQIEARRVGILKTPPTGPMPVYLIIDMDNEETDRLPEPRSDGLLGVDLPCLRKANLAHFPAAILLYLKQDT